MTDVNAMSDGEIAFHAPTIDQKLPIVFQDNTSQSVPLSIRKDIDYIWAMLRSDVNHSVLNTITAEESNLNSDLPLA